MATSRGQGVERSRHQEGLWEWRHSKEGQELAALLKDVIQAWLDYDWVKGRQERVGRPRTADYPQGTLLRAHRVYGNGV